MLINISNSYTIPITTLSEETGRRDVLPAFFKPLTELSKDPITFASETHVWQGNFTYLPRCVCLEVCIASLTKPISVDHLFYLDLVFCKLLLWFNFIFSHANLFSKKISEL